MPIFIYRALNKEGHQQEGEVQAESRGMAIEYLQREKLTPIFIEKIGYVERKQFSFLSLFFLGGGIDISDKMFLTRHLSAILKSGISLSEALEILSEDTTKKSFKKILFDAKMNLERGQPLSATLESYAQYFSPIFIGLIKAGEESGTLEETLEGLGEQLRRDYEMKKRVQSAMIYPAILLSASLLIVVLLLTFIMPRLTKALLQAKVSLPWITRFLIGLSQVFSSNPIATLSVFILLIISIFFFVKSKFGRKVIVGILEKLPVSGNLIKKLALVRFSRTFRNLLASGLSAFESLDITAKTIGIQSYEKTLLNIREEIKKGSTISNSFKEKKEFFPQLVISIIAVGEKTGTLEKSLATITDYYDEEADRILKNIVSLIEPALLIVMGVVIAGIALSILLPIYQLVSSFK
ncbi:MAG: type II secretion system F family protein [Patescibacteria group bacterium]